jgi:hypothetical protein
MTVTSCLISSRGTVHACDSLITQLDQGGNHIPKEWERSKIVPVRHWRGAMSYWGLATYERYRWDTYDWLREQAQNAASFSGPEEFAIGVAQGILIRLKQMEFPSPTDAGIGIHFSAYERIGDRWIPELFLISNFADTSYSSLRSEGVGATREAAKSVASDLGHPIDQVEDQRLFVHEYLHSGQFLIFNNGDPIMFNAVATGVFSALRTLSVRRTLRELTIDLLSEIVRRPVEIVSELQSQFARPGTRMVGGRIHDLVIVPTGDMTSRSGDNK